MAADRIDQLLAEAQRIYRGVDAFAKDRDREARLNRLREQINMALQQSPQETPR